MVLKQRLRFHLGEASGEYLLVFAVQDVRVKRISEGSAIDNEANPFFPLIIL
jgi:hypothetical protein